MQEIREAIGGLNIRFNTAFQSLSDKDFYQSLYYYFDFIHKTSKLMSIFNNSEEYYITKHREIWKEKPKTDKETDEKSAQTIKLEKFNLFAVGASIYMRIYLPIKEYKNTNEPDSEQDPVAILLVRGIGYALSLNKWSKETLKIYNRWFEGRRNYYASELQRFHMIFLDELEKIKEKTNGKLNISFDKEQSILLINEKKVHIQQKNDKPNSHYVLEYIFENQEGLKEKSYYSEILDKKFIGDDLNWRSLYRACIDINEKVNKQGEIKDFLIIKTGKTGYTHINPSYL